MIKQIQQQIEPLLAEHNGTTALFLSGGSDSLLLLRILLDMKAEFRCLAFDSSFSREQRAVLDNIVDRFGVRVFSYPPADAYLIGDGAKRVSMVEEYATLGPVFPFVRECEQDDAKCIYDHKFDGRRQETAPIAFTLYLSGARRTDRHHTTGQAWREPLLKSGNATFFAPLWKMTREMVTLELACFGEQVPKVDTGVLGLCLKCLTATASVKCPQSGEMVEPHVWAPVETMKAFRQRFKL